MMVITNQNAWQTSRKQWWELYAYKDDSCSYVARVKSKGLAYIVAQQLLTVYPKIEIR